MSDKFQLFEGDCLEVMKQFPDNYFDACVTDPPYGTTACKWDTVIPFAPMWEQLHRIVKPTGAIALFGSEPFSSALRMSDIKNFKYDWIWRKNKKVGFLNANKMPLLEHESITVFYRELCTYNPQMTIGKKHVRGSLRHRGSDNYGCFSPKEYQSNLWYPSTVLDMKSSSAACVTFTTKPNRLKTHPTQKPVALMKYLIQTYTNTGERVLDFTMGSGTTGVACAQLGRRFVGIELDHDYFEIARKRIENAYAQPTLFETVKVEETAEQSKLF